MRRKAFSIRPLADAEFDAALNWYLAEAGTAAALRFLDAVQAAHDLIAQASGVGAPGLGLEMGMQGLRTWRIAGFPYLVLYLDDENSVEIVRFLHAFRDVPKALTDDVE